MHAGMNAGRTMACVRANLIRTVMLGGAVGLAALSAGPQRPPGAENVVLPAGGLCAHRGGGAAHPENTLPAFRAAVQLGVPMIEFDVALTKDDRLVVLHDATVDRTTDGHGLVTAFDLADLKRLDAGAWKDPRFAGTRVPTVEEVLAELPRNVWINLDLKGEERIAGRDVEVATRLARLIAADGRLHQTIFAARADAAAAAKQAFPDLLVCSMDRRPDPADYVADAIRRRVAFIQLRDCATDPRFPGWLKQLKAAGVRVNYFYTNDRAEYARLRGLGVDFVLVDDVARLVARQAPAADGK
jgi:glycerophosphoryl diester phosphodiesterase